MISVGSRDGRKGMGLGFDVPREMEETELEEGEACSFPDDDPSVDPDIALSYIDEKIQDVLGHFQKDFEGGVSAENLGAKFGGYGSFLPTYQRSPLWSHPRSPASSQIRNTHSSPNNLKMEGARLNSVVPSSAPQKRLDMAPSNAMSLPAVMKPFANDMAKSEVDKIPCDSAQEFTSRPNHVDQKTLRVRIKVGSDNLMTRKNAEIYSGLGLDDSPSLSLDESPTESEGLSHVPQALESSPTSILQIMTSFPVYGDLLLSPISDDLLCLTEKKCLREIKKRPFTKNKQDIPNGFGNGLVPLKGDQRILGNRKIKSMGSKGSPVELENGNKDTNNENGVGYNKKVDVDLLGCEELVLKALKPPLLVNSYSAVGGTEESAVNPCDMQREANKGNDKSFSVLAKEEVQDPMATEEIVCAEQPNGKSASAVKVWEDMNPNSLNDASVCGRNDGDREAGRAYDSIKAESNASKGKKVPAVELLDAPKQKGNQKVISHEQESLKEPIVGKEVSSSIGKKKSKVSQVHSNPGADTLKESWRADPPLLLKNKKGTHGDNCLLKGELGASKTQKVIRKASEAYDRYKDFFGDMNMEEDEYEMDSAEMPYDGRVNSEVVEKRTSSFSSGSRDKMSSKKNDKALKSEYFAKVVSSTTFLGGNGPISEAVPLMGNGPNGDAIPLIRNGPNFDAPPSGIGPISDATLPNGNGSTSDVTPAVVAPAGVEEKDGWVCCDKCQKWRLLPIGTNPDDLPEKWLCSMLNWLPGMNRCSVSEEETTNALTQRYQVPPTGSQNYLHGHADAIVSTVNVEDFRLLNQSRQNDCFHGPANGKKKNELKEMSNSFDQCAPQHFSNPTKKNLQALAKCKNLYDVNQLASSSDLDFQQSSKSSDLHSEKQRLMPKEKHKVIEQPPRGGDAKKIKVKSRWEIDPQDCSSDIKKFKKDGIQNLDEDQISNRIGANDKVGPSLSVLETDVTMMDRPKHSGRSSSVDLKCHVKDESQHSARKLKNGLQATLHDKEMLDSKDVTKKRKVKDPLESKDVLKELSGNDKGKGKKARLPKYDAKEANGSKASTRKDKKDDCIHQCLDGMDPLKKDLGSVQPSVATTSSSSKVSGSHKTKVNILELKSSPVESVSSSPLRISIPDKPTSVRRNAIANGSPRRCLDSADDRSGRSERSKSNRNANSTHHRSFESPVLDIQERDHSHLTGSKAKQLYFSELKNSDLPTNVSHTLGHDTQCSSELQALDYFHNEEINHENHYPDHGSHLRKSGKGSSTCSKDNDRSYKSEFDNGKTRISDSSIDCLDHAHSHQEKTKERKRKSHEKTGLKYAKTDNISAGKKLNLSSGNNKRESRSKFDEHNLDVKVDGICSRNEMSSPNRNRLLDRDGERSSKKFHSDKNNRANLVPGRGSSLPLPPSGGGENETRIRSQKPSSWSQKGPGPDASDGGEDALVMEKHHRMVDNQNGIQQTSSRQSTPSGQRGRAFDAPSPVRRDSSQEAPSLLKEATNLKHMADRFKNAGSHVESTGLYFQASLKFLHAASLMESGNIDGGKHAEMIQSMQIYSTTAKLLEFCAHEYEKLKDMSAAALACKCAEVAYMRVIYSSHNTASRDRHDLQVSLQMIAPGESPSSSASDVDNLNNPPTADKFALVKGVGSPQVAGNHVIAARHRPNFMRLLTFTQNVNSAMEASRKSGVAFSAAKVHLEDAQHSEGISSIKRALDYNFQDVEGLLRLVRLAMEAMSRG